VLRHSGVGGHGTVCSTAATTRRSCRRLRCRAGRPRSPAFHARARVERGRPGCGGSGSQHRLLLGETRRDLGRRPFPPSGDCHPPPPDTLHFETGPPLGERNTKRGPRSTVDRLATHPLAGCVTPSGVIQSAPTLTTCRMSGGIGAISGRTKAPATAAAMATQRRR